MTAVRDLGKMPHEIIHKLRIFKLYDANKFKTIKSTNIFEESEKRYMNFHEKTIVVVESQ